MDNVIKAYFYSGNIARTNTVFQYNRGMILKFMDVDLPATYRVDFANSLTGQSKTCVGTADGVIVPLEMMAKGCTVYAWAVIANEDSTVTEYQAMIPISPRAEPTDEAPNPEQQQVIDQLIAAMNQAVEQTGADVENADAAAAAAAASEQAAAASETAAAESASSASEDAATASSAASAAGQQADIATSGAETATQKAADAAASAQDAASSETAAAGSAAAAATSETNAETAETAAQTAQAAAEAAAQSVSESAAQIQENKEDIADLKSATANLDNYFAKGINLFNPNDPDLVENVELKNDGTTAAKAGYFASGYVPVELGKTICLNYPTGTYGTASSIVFYDENKQRIGYTASVERLVDSRGYNYIRYAIPSTGQAKYIRVTGYMSNSPVYMYVYAAEMPAVYVPYTDKVTLSDDVIVPFENIQDVAISKDETDFIAPEPINMVDLSACVPGIIKNSTSNGGIDENSLWVTTDYIPVEPGETYALCIFPGVNYGAGFAGIPVYDGNKNQIARVKQAGGSVASIASRVTITIPDRTDAKYIRTSYYKSYTDNPKRWWQCQIFKASAWPTDMYIPYDGSDKLIGVGLTDTESVKYNALFGKSAMWNGDSICAADGDPQGGWPGRVAVSNGMMFKNYGISGGTITENTTASHSVSATLDTMISDFPNADYIIIEGGTNDADILGADGIGAFDADDFSAEYIAALDKDTFSGALESIFYRLVTQMKGKHIGYLIPQKMGHTEVLVTRRRQYFDRAVAIAQKWGIPVLDLWNGLYFNWRLAAHWDQSMTTTENENAGNLYLDGQHLTTTGYAIESPIIAEWMRSF